MGNDVFGAGFEVQKLVFIGDTITAKVTVSEILNPEKGIYKLDTIVLNSKEEIVTEGYAVVKYMG